MGLGMRVVNQDLLEPRPPPVDRRSVAQRIVKSYFGSPASAFATILIVAVLAWAGWSFLNWSLLNATFPDATGSSSACRRANGGACWAVVADKFRLIIFGVYPHAQHWRPACMMALFLVMYFLSTRPSMWNWKLPAAWVAAITASACLMWGGFAGLPFVPDDQWGGLPITMILATLGLATGFPLAILLALARNSRRHPVGKALAVAYIELTRSVPLLALLFLASLMIPLFMPAGWDIPKLFRVLVAFTLVTAAYLAEVIRGGLLSIPRGQYEAAEALGLSRWTTTTRVVLPQALVAVLPAIVNVLIAFFKATSIVLIVGIFDLMTAAKRAAADSQWQGFGTEIYLFVAAIYFAFCFVMSVYSNRLHARLRAQGKQ